MIKMESIEILNLVGVRKILIYLLDKNEKSCISDLKNNAGISQDAIYKALPVLQNYDLIEEKDAEGFSRRHDVWLNSKGKKVAKLLCEMEKALSE